MHTSDIERILTELCQQNEDILLVMLVSSDGLPLCYVGNAEDFDTAGALYIELKLICDRILDNLMMGNPEHIFVRAGKGCVDIWPAGDLGVLACMTRPGINPQKLQIQMWRAVAALLKPG